MNTIYHIFPFSVGFFFLLSKRYFVNQHILFKLSVVNIVFGDEQKVLIVETYLETELP